MRKLISLLLLASAGAYGQVAISANVAPQGFQVLPGSLRNISAQIGNTSIASGPVLTIALASGGTGYNKYDIGSACNGHVSSTCADIPEIQQSGSSNTAKFVITSINPATGAVTGIQLLPHAYSASYAGTGYTVANGLATVNGHGTGLTVNVTSVGQCTTAAGLACTVNWAVASTTGGATATLTNVGNTGVSSISGAIPTVQVNIGSTAGNCTINTLASGIYDVTSTATVTVTATATDSPNPVATFLFNVCQNLTTATQANGDPAVVVIPQYQQAFQGQLVSLQSFVRQNVDQDGVWSIVSQAPGGNGTLSATAYDMACVTAGFTDCQDKTFSATVSGRYVVGFTSNVTGSMSTAIVYVSPNALPSYTSTPQITRPTECYPDPNITPDFEVGPSQTYPTIESIPNIAAVSGGYILRLHNEDTTGTNPTTYPEYFGVRYSGSQTNPVYICGVPDSLGNLPVISTANATGQAGTPQPGYGSIVIWPTTHYNTWQFGSAGPNYVTVAGIHFLMPGGYTANTFTNPGGTAATCPNLYIAPATVTCPWIFESIPIWVGSGTYITETGNFFDQYPDATFTADNASTDQWSTVTQGVYINGNHMTGYFNNCTSSCDQAHAMYIQSYYTVMEGNVINGPVGSSIGADIKSRSVDAIIRYNYVGAGSSTAFDLVDIQDAYNYQTFEGYLGPVGPYFEGDTAGANVLAGFQESANNLFVYGNLVFPMASPYTRFVYYDEDHDGEMSAENGFLWYYNNTTYGDSNSFDNSTTEGYNTYYQQQFNAQNNIFWPANAWYAMNFQNTQIHNSLTNMFETGSMCLGTYSGGVCTTGTIVGGSLSAKTSRGWQNLCDFICAFPLANPLNTHIYNLSAPNYLTTATQPMSSTTLAPIASSPAIGAGTTLVGLAAKLPVRFQYLVNTGSLYPRIFPTTLGAVENSPGPALVSIAITPTSATVGTGLTVNFTATCTYSDFSTTNCSSSVTWGSSNTGIATVSISGQATGIGAGVVSISASSGSVNAPNAGLTVFVVPSSTQTGTTETGTQHY